MMATFLMFGLKTTFFIIASIVTALAVDVRNTQRKKACSLLVTDCVETGDSTGMFAWAAIGISARVALPIDAPRITLTFSCRIRRVAPRAASVGLLWSS